MLMSMWSVHYDKEHWGDPEVFRPERHLDDDGKLIIDEWFLPFGLGEWKSNRLPLAKSLTASNLYD